MYVVMICFALMQFGMMFSSMASASASAKRINAVMDCPLEIVDGNIDVTTIKEVGTIEFKNVSFAYPESNEYVLENHVGSSNFIFEYTLYVYTYFVEGASSISVLLCKHFWSSHTLEG